MTREMIREMIRKVIAEEYSVVRKPENIMDIMYKEQVNEGIQNGTSAYDIYGNIFELKR